MKMVVEKQDFVFYSTTSPIKKKRLLNIPVDHKNGPNNGFQLNRKVFDQQLLNEAELLGQQLFSGLLN